MAINTTRARSVKGLLTGLVVALGASAAMAVWAQPGPHGGSPGGWMGGRGGPGLLMRGSPEHIDRAVDRLLDPVQATDAQRAQVKQIARAAAKDVRAQMDAGRALREQGRALFTAPVLDEAAIESLRQQMSRQHDAVSQRMSQAMVDIAKVLTPEQRKALADRLEKRRGDGHGDRHGHRPAAPPPPKDPGQGAIPSSFPMT